MNLRIFAGAAALVLAVAMTSGVMASGHQGAHHWRHHHRVITGDGDAGPAYGGRYYSLGPLGFTSVPPGHCGPTCVPGSSIAAWSR